VEGEPAKEYEWRGEETRGGVAKNRPDGIRKGGWVALVTGWSKKKVFKIHEGRRASLKMSLR